MNCQTIVKTVKLYYVKKEQNGFYTSAFYEKNKYLL